MGYSHRWIRRRDLDRKRFRQAAGDCRQVCRAAGVLLQGIDTLQDPVFGYCIVAFDGGGEWFVVQCTCDENSPERPMPDKPGWHFGFCKTGHLPYEVCVQACLITFKHYLERDFLIQSDSDDDAWERARKICQHALGYGREFRLKVAEDRAG